VCQANGTPGEESGQTGQSLKPGKNFLTGRADVDVSKDTEQDGDQHGPERAAGAVNIGEKFGSVALLGERGKGTGRAVNTRDTDG
jgi:hypothetical protein